MLFSQGDGSVRIVRSTSCREIRARDVGIPMVVLAELWFGAEKSTRKDANRTRIERLTTQVTVHTLGPTVARRYGMVRADIEQQGRRKSDFDLIIACTALEQQATLVTNDAALKDGAIKGLTVEDWLARDDED